VKKYIFIILSECFLFVSLVSAQKYAIISDIHGSTSNTFEVSVLVKSWSPEFIITAGDNHYGSQTSIDYQVGQYYSSFIFPYNGVYGTGDTVNRFFPCIGNHDCDGTGLNNYLQYFNLPGNERYYDFVKGDVHFYSINCNLNEPDGVYDTSVQAHWLRDHLAVSASLYNVVYFHMPAFTSGMHGSTTYMQWPFKQWGASIVFSGHDHDYERLYIDSFPFIVCGVSGGTLYTVYNPIAGSVFSDVINHGAVLANTNTDSMYFEFRNKSDSLIDHFSIFPNHLSVNTNYLYDVKKPELFQNYPNPVYLGSVIKFYLPFKGMVNISASDILGNTYKIVSQKTMSAGFHEVKWDTSKLNNGLYFYSLYFNRIVITKKATLL